MSRSSVWTRSGDSKNTRVRGSCWSDCSRRIRSLGFFDGNPSNVNRSVGSPLTTRAARTADGPGITRTTIPSAMHAVTTR